MTNTFKKPALLLLLLLAAVSASAQTRALSILHTNDLHARLLPDYQGQGGFAHLATVLRRETEGCSSCLILNGGDLAQGSPASTIYRGLPEYELANLFNFSASVLGNHEFDYGFERIRSFARTAKFPLLAVNVRDPRGRLIADRASVILKVNGVRVAVIGALTADLPELITPQSQGPWRALPVTPAVREEARRLRDSSDLIVVLGHLNEDEEMSLLRDVPEVAVVISGHVHAGLEAPFDLDGRVMVRMKAYGVEAGRLDLDVDMGRSAVARYTWKKIPVNAREIPPAPDMARKVEQWESKVRKIVDQPIGESRREFDRAALQKLLSHAMAEEMGTDLGFVNLGGIRDLLPAGPLLARHIWNIMPFDNLVVIGRIRGSQLPPALKALYAIDPEREYTLALSDFVATNQQAELGVTGLSFLQPTGRPLRDVLIDWVKKKKVIE